MHLASQMATPFSTNHRKLPPARHSLSKDSPLDADSLPREPPASAGCPLKPPLTLPRLDPRFSPLHCLPHADKQDRGQGRELSLQRSPPSYGPLDPLFDARPFPLPVFPARSPTPSVHKELGIPSCSAPPPRDFLIPTFSRHRPFLLREACSPFSPRLCR